MDLEKHFRSIIANYGHEIWLQRRSDYKAGGFDEKLERWTVRFSGPRRFRLPTSASEVGEGIIHEGDSVYYFLVEAKPREGDRIYEADDRYPSGFTIWTIDWAQPMRGRAGEIVYWACGATRQNPS